MIELLRTIEEITPEGGDWCTVGKAHALAAMILANRPTVCVEIGVWRGGSAIPMALALQHVGDRGHLFAIDPWSVDASLDGEAKINQDWWGGVVGQSGHEESYRVFCGRIVKHNLQNVRILRMRSDDVPVLSLATPQLPIDLLHIDGNHAAQAVRDVERFCPHVRQGGMLVMDDVQWISGHVQAGVEMAKAMGFVEMYPLDTGLVMQRRYHDRKPMVIRGVGPFEP